MCGDQRQGDQQTGRPNGCFVGGLILGTGGMTASMLNIRASLTSCIARMVSETAKAAKPAPVSILRQAHGNTAARSPRMPLLQTHSPAQQQHLALFEVGSVTDGRLLVGVRHALQALSQLLLLGCLLLPGQLLVWEHARADLVRVVQQVLLQQGLEDLVSSRQAILSHHWACQMVGELHNICSGIGKR